MDLKKFEKQATLCYYSFRIQNPIMKTTTTLSKADLDRLLGWLSADQEAAGKKYLEIREGLVRYFRIKGCYESQSLADETINRVAMKLKTFQLTSELKPITYFYGFAKNIFFEYLAELKRSPMQIEPELAGRLEGQTDDGEDKETRFHCLDDCMAKLRTDESEMVRAYYAKDRSEKFEARRRLADSLNISIGNLHIRVHRVKKILRECLESCLERI